MSEGIDLFDNTYIDKWDATRFQIIKAETYNKLLKNSIILRKTNFITYL